MTKYWVSLAAAWAMLLSLTAYAITTDNPAEPRAVASEQINHCCYRGRGRRL